MCGACGADRGAADWARPFLAGARVGGFANGEEPPPVMEFLSSGEGLQLSLAFMRIRDSKVRRRLLELVRSLAGEPEMEVNFSSEPPSLKGLKARLPAPTRTLPPHEVALVRGTGGRPCSASNWLIGWPTERQPNPLRYSATSLRSPW